jgi:hypothetical protein
VTEHLRGFQIETSRRPIRADHPAARCHCNDGE